VNSDLATSPIERTCLASTELENGHIDTGLALALR